MSEEKSGSEISTNNGQPSYLVAIGASAGGLEALEKLFKQLPSDTGMAFVVIQHLSPDFKSLMDELLQRCTEMPVIAISEEMECQPNHVYLMPPNREILVKGNRLVPHQRPKDMHLSMPINLFLRSLAVEWSERAVGIILSGTGSDGSSGVLDIRQFGGVVIAQQPESCRFDGMPRSAIASGCVDAVLRPEEMPDTLNNLSRNPMLFQNKEEGDLPASGLKAIFEELRIQFSIDFGQYKPTTINRRIHRRMAFQGGALDINSYAKRLKTDREELGALYRDLLIGVTSFFRDEEAFLALQQGVLSNLIDQLEPEEELRAWVCGCSTGEEAYTVAMLVLEELERKEKPPLLKIFATDLHPDSLRIAADGVYSADRLSSVPSSLKKKYFSQMTQEEYRVNQNLRRHIIFSEHNLLKNPPFTRMHLVTCRNLLIYLQPEVQSPAMVSFNFSLVHDGILMLGTSETLGNLSEDFEAVDRHWKIYRKTKESHSRLGSRPPAAFSRLTSIESSKNRDDRSQPLSRLYNSLLDRYIPTGFLLNERNELLHVFGDAQDFMKPPSGRVSGDVFPLLNNSLSIALNTALRTVKEQSGSLTYRGVFGGGDGSVLELTLEPLYDRISNSRFYMVVLQPQKNEMGNLSDISQTVDFSLTEETAEFVRQLQHELLRTKEALQANAEELETSNEELQASNEELIASNEELQSTNEELHSVNEELYTVNSEHEHKILELDKLSKELRNLVDSTDLSLIFVDEKFKIKTFTPKSVEVFNLVNSDIGRDIRDFMPKVEDPDLSKDLQAVLSTKKSREVLLQHQKHGSKVVQCLRRTCAPHGNGFDSDWGIILSYEDVTLEQGLELQIDMFRSLVNRNQEPVLMLDGLGVIVYISTAMSELLKISEGEWVGMEFASALAGTQNKPLDQEKLLNASMPTEVKVNKLTLRCTPWLNFSQTGWLVEVA